MVIDIFSCTNLKIDYQQKKYFLRFASVQYLLVQNETGIVTTNISRETLDKESRFVHF